MFQAVRTYDNYISANLMLQRLEEENIRAYLQDEHTVTSYPVLSNAIGGIKLMVFEEQVGRALELIAGFEQTYRQAVACPRCGSLNVHFVTQSTNPVNWLSAITSWLFGNYAVAFKQVYRCFDCGYEREDLPDRDVHQE
ncbi:MAG: DUF2007 domain-containing protein [Candidatus Pseudobacter hemicellulosilyticus]|uniref:DUF2007 domain-containing protein n=1 Tax=Candidatus Pseudobacter hemicellulosilyticus TaxID=3121375 RepID=A0AAJ6BGN4_9BACT|nr:MAG: DUF2007 domain-containing protein [Pseudobacter sp.]